MELKELILSTLEELDEKIAEDGVKAEELLKEQEERIEAEILERIEAESQKEEEVKEPLVDNSDEVAFLEHTRERMLVLFEGLQAEETKNIEAKLDITLNFLEYYLATIEDRLDEKK
ncbi:MAG TPA: hypothetical protein EYG95_05150 [Campylobacterales bacterium]|nr:hypothetical protein [Campylobacterales bacterium]